MDKGQHASEHPDQSFAPAKRAKLADFDNAQSRAV
jgi:hypothetical protein